VLIRFVPNPSKNLVRNNNNIESWSVKMDVIFWFSGTGNSLYAAKQLASNLGNMSLIQMTKYSQPVGGEYCKVGFVFPSYYGNLPRAVRAFVKELEILPNTYIFAIVTGGGAKTGSVRELRSVLKEKSLHLSYGHGLYMKGNYVVKYDPADPEKMNKTLEKADKHLQKFASDISAEVLSVKAIPITSNNLYKNIEALDNAFIVNDACVGCGLCEKLCPVSNISLLEDSTRPGKRKPEWLHHCEHCMACISWCPAKSINYGDLTQSRRRYHNPRIKVEELYRD
jgi:formate hydrogenlyase subunit 6/NADH:ubiquinone oxidoreductase subunit I